MTPAAMSQDCGTGCWNPAAAGRRPRPPTGRALERDEEATLSRVMALHDAVRRGDLERIGALLDEDARLVNAPSDSDPRGTSSLHVAAEFGQAAAARILLQYGADVSLLDSENEATALGWAAFFGRTEVVAAPSDCAITPLPHVRTDPSQASRARTRAASRVGRGST
jgi:hypothetical protein